MHRPKPNSKVIESLAPDAISKTTGRILVKPTLQVRNADHVLPAVFAMGDVAETGGPRMARAGFFQSEIAVANILSSIHERTLTAKYLPRKDIEGALKLTLGKVSM